MRVILILLLRVVLGLLFLAIGTTKLTGTENTIDYFAAIGWGQWLRYLTGFVDVAGAVMLFVPGFTCYGAIGLTASVGLATLLSFTILHGNPDWSGGAMTVIPLAVTLLCAGLVWLSSPGRYRP